MQISLKDANGALLNITGSDPTELARNYDGVKSLPQFSGFFTILSPSEIEAVLQSHTPTPAAPAAQPTAAAKTVSNPGKPATEKQVAFLKKNGVAIEGLTAGAASAEIDRIIKEKK